ncbi:MAG TPA: TlyA family RNA methyltransferase [Propionibacteriaceae bacterium]|nr:TlyA family RNA methyltransferase [Propionibacteriaceae bacterium]
MNSGAPGPRRLDLELAARGLARSRSQARELVRSRRVLVDGRVVDKPSEPVTAAQRVSLSEKDPWVSRAAHKLVGALDALAWTDLGARALDAGASTGGFTQVLLSRGAERVYSVDVGHDQLAPQLRADPRVVVREGLNLRGLTLDDLEGRPVDLVVADVSFISLTLLLDPLFSVIAPGGRALLMVKPQFEVGRELLGPGGVVRDENLRVRAVEGVVAAASDLGWTPTWRGTSPLPGPAGNIEYFVAFERAGAPLAGRPARIVRGSD